MKYNCGPSYEEREAARKKWHRWFAWHPVRVGPGECRWLEPVERRGWIYLNMFDCGWAYEYRALEAGRT